MFIRWSSQDDEEEPEEAMEDDRDGSEYDEGSHGDYEDDDSDYEDESSGISETAIDTDFLLVAPFRFHLPHWHLDIKNTPLVFPSGVPLHKRPFDTQHVAKKFACACNALYVTYWYYPLRTELSSYQWLCILRFLCAGHDFRADIKR